MKTSFNFEQTNRFQFRLNIIPPTIRLLCVAITRPRADASARLPMVPFPLSLSLSRTESRPIPLYPPLLLPVLPPSIVSIIDGEVAHVENGWLLERILSLRQCRSHVQITPAYISTRIFVCTSASRSYGCSKLTSPFPEFALTVSGAISNWRLDFRPFSDASIKR